MNTVPNLTTITLRTLAFLVLAVKSSLILVSISTLAWSDQLVLKNGDRVTGKIVKKDGKTLAFKSQLLGLVNVAWDQVASVSTDEQVNVALSNAKELEANLQTREDRIELTGPGGVRETVLPSDIVALRNSEEQRTYARFLRPGLFDLWVVTGSFNIAGAKGNAETSVLTTPVSFVRASRTSRTTAYFNSIRSTAQVGGVSGETAKAIRGGWAYSRKLTARLSANGFNDYEFDKFQALDLRVVMGAGLGYEILNRERSGLMLVGGAAWNRESFGPANAPSFTRNSAEAFWGDDFHLNLSPRTDIVQSFRMFNNLSNTGEFRMNFDLGTKTQLNRWLIWNVALSDRYLSNPVTGRERNDFLYTFGLGFTFSR